MSRHLGKRTNFKHAAKNLAEENRQLTAALQEMAEAVKAGNARFEALEKVVSQLTEIVTGLSGKGAAGSGKAKDAERPPEGLITERTYELFEMHRGREMDQVLQACAAKIRIWQDQNRGIAAALMKAAVTEREARMLESNYGRLFRQRQALYGRCEKQAINELRDIETGRHYNPGDPKPWTTGREANLLSSLPTFEPAEIDSFIEWHIAPHEHQATMADQRISEVFDAVAAAGIEHPQAAEAMKEIRRRLAQKYPDAENFPAAVARMRADMEAATDAAMQAEMQANMEYS